MRHSLFPLAAASACFLSLCVACGNDAGSDDDIGSSSGSAETGSSGAVSQTDAGSSGGDVVPAGTVVLRIEGTDIPLTLADLPHTMFKDTEVVSLTAIWTAAAVRTPYAAYVFDFVGTDGFRPSSRDKCKTVVFDGATFAKGYVELASQRLTWDDDLGFSGCAFVTGLTRIEATSP